MKDLIVIALAGLVVAGCTPKPAAPPPVQANAMAPAAFGPPPAAANGAAPAVQAAQECASYGLKAGTADYNSCVAGMTKADEAIAGDAGDEETPANAAQMRADMRADMDRDRAEDEREMRDAQHPADGSASHCVTTRHGSNVSTVCP